MAHVHANNYHEFKGQTTYTLWDHEECGGYPFYTTRDEALECAAKVMTDRVYHGPVPFMYLVVAQHGKGCGHPTEKLVLGEVK